MKLAILFFILCSTVFLVSGRRHSRGHRSSTLFVSENPTGIDYLLRQKPWMHHKKSSNSPHYHVFDEDSFWKLCSNPENDLVEVNEFQLNPSAPLRGEEIELLFQGKLKREIIAGSYAIATVKLGVIQLFRGKLDICEELKQGYSDYRCPVKPGNIEVDAKVVIPQEVPPGEYNIHLEVFTEKDEKMICLDMKLKLKV
ncbi:ML domain-containing protein [Paraphysoderma sedebokerense]|nr:ML domain-containing protein [Paraphysoderma sedebokerense]